MDLRGLEAMLLVAALSWWMTAPDGTERSWSLDWLEDPVEYADELVLGEISLRLSP